MRATSISARIIGLGIIAILGLSTPLLRSQAVMELFRGQGAQPQSGIVQDTNRSLEPVNCCGEPARQSDNDALLRTAMEKRYGVAVQGAWAEDELLLLEQALGSVRAVFSSLELESGASSTAFANAFGGVELVRIRQFERQYGATTSHAWTTSSSRIEFYDGTFQEKLHNGRAAARTPMNIRETFIHELAHVWDLRSDGRLSDGLKDAVSGRYALEISLLGIQIRRGAYSVAVKSPYGIFDPPNHLEDWAKTFALFVVDEGRLDAVSGSADRSGYLRSQNSVLASL